MTIDLERMETKIDRLSEKMSDVRETVATLAAGEASFSQKMAELVDVVKNHEMRINSVEKNLNGLEIKLGMFGGIAGIVSVVVQFFNWKR